MPSKVKHPPRALTQYQVTNAYDPAVYDGWTVQAGHGIITKLSFIPGYAGGVSSQDDPGAAEGEEPDNPDGEKTAGEDLDETAAPDDDGAGGGAMTILIIIVAVLAVLNIGAVLMSRRKANRPATEQPRP